MAEIQQGQKDLSQVVCPGDEKARPLLRPEKAGPGIGQAHGEGFLPGRPGQRGAVQGRGLV